MADISAIKLPNGTTYNLKDTTARNAANSAVPNTRTVNGKALSSNISLGAGDVGAYTKSETDTKINAAVASTYKYKGSVTADKLPTSGQVVGDVYNITNDSSYGKAGMNVAWNGTTWDALGSNVDLSNYVTTSDSRLSNARPASDVYAWAKAAKKPSYSASEIGAAPASHTHTKDQVGLGNVANLDQSKAIKSITRSGTTFTATALDGTTTTFTQQDNNTTYGLASQSSNGLMSAADKKAVDREFFRMLPKGGTYIPPDADLNSIQYLKVGNYYNSANVETQTMKNCPAGAFIMYVLSPLSEAYDDESTRTWVYRLRIFVEHRGNIYTQLVNSGATAGSFDYGPWIKMTNSDDLGAVSNTINDHIANKANPHGVTKAQVGLGDVDNTADSAKSVKYASSAGSADTVDGLHEYSFLRYRDSTSTNGAETLWSQIGIREYDNAHPDGITDGYTYGSVVSLPGGNTRFDLWYNHQTSSNGDGLRYRTGWGNDKKAWATILDSVNYNKFAPTKTGTGASGTWGINVTGNAGTVNGHTVNADVPSGAKFTDTTYSVATQSANGLMSAADKKKLDSYTTGSAGGAVEVTLAAASWSSSTTEINGNNYYTYSVSVANIGNPHPQIFCSGGNSIIPSAI